MTTLVVVLVVVALWQARRIGRLRALLQAACDRERLAATEIRALTDELDTAEAEVRRLTGLLAAPEQGRAS